MTTAPHPEHGPGELCPAGKALYERALREGHVAARDTAAAPCLVDGGLLHPAVDDMLRLLPVAPAVALQRLLRASAEHLARVRRQEERLTQDFEPLLRLGGGRAALTEPPAVRVLSGTARINEAITDAMEGATREVLTVQPRAGLTGRRGEVADVVSFARDQSLLDRGGRIRTLYQTTVRHFPVVTARHERLRGDVEVRALDEVMDRLILIDREVAFLPADKDGSVAVETRHPAIVTYLCTAFDRFWRLAAPLYLSPSDLRSVDGVTPRQRAIAELLTEGHTDAVIAERLGMNIRTARVHIAKLAATLGSSSRAQLGYLIARSGILDPQP
ncbi:LuxR C-terminal-related transcriptional regulator [Streptomyces sp. NPDC029526]|uniref:LuxR C-terminal-related transcriptional regulator n=1 Tax=Streptomyces sp. NPDC029526 TaxID=3155728 RepID=UPI0034105617